MCELFGFSGNKRTDLKGLLTEFFSHSVNNPDGWGLASFDDSHTLIYKERVAAYKSPNIERIIKETGKARTLIGHIRLATIGYDDYNNSHPFSGYDRSGRLWTLAHNGTIFECDELSIYSYKQKGSTDSERVFLYLLDKINEKIDEKKGDLDAKERFDIVDGIVTKLSPKNKLNIIIYDGEQTYLHTNYRDSLYVNNTSDGAVFATVPLSDGVWDHLPFKTLVSYKNGKPFLSGKEHEGEYIPDEQAIRAIFMAYAGL